jgi:hypothetical protein
MMAETAGPKSHEFCTSFGLLETDAGYKTCVLQFGGDKPWLFAAKQLAYVLFSGFITRYSIENKERRLFLRQMYIQTQQKQALSILDKIQDVLLVIKPDAIDGKYQVVFSNY